MGLENHKQTDEIGSQVIRENVGKREDQGQSLGPPKHRGLVEGRSQIKRLRKSGP